MDITKYLPKDLFKGKTVFVTGGGSGINLGVGRAFATLGANIGICGRTREKLDAAAVQLTDLGAKVVAEVADVRDYQALQAALEKCRSTLGAVDVLVCGAAGNFPIPAEKLTPNGFKSVIDRDYPVVFANLYIFSLLGLFVGLLSDLIYTWVDPRIDFERRDV